jgi:hypothetical protein
LKGHSDIESLGGFGKRLLILLTAGILSGARICAAEPLPAAAEVTRRMVERSQAIARFDGPQCTYCKRSWLERMDSTGRTLSSEEKVYLVTVIAGVPFNRLLKIQGRDLSAEELAREDAKEERFQQRFVPADRKKLASRREGLVTPELLGRYDFVVEGRTVLSNRPTLVLSFKPKTGSLPTTKLVDRLLNRMAGKLWVDEQDADTARVEVRLIEPLYLGWFGWMGSLTQFELSLTRQRMLDDIWVNAKQTLLIQCRKVTTPVRFRLTEESSEFKKVGGG